MKRMLSWLSLLCLSCSALAASVPVSLAVGGAAVYGTELTPDGVQGRVPVVVMHAGSGPTDRDGNSHLLPGPNDSLKMLAEGLARQGIASVRYDKRGIGASAYPGWREQDLRFDDYIADAAAWVARLRADPRFSRVILIGHSEGAQIVAQACAMAKADGCVLLAGAGHPADELLRAQLAQQLPPPLLAENERILTALKQGQPVVDVPAPLQALYHASVQPYLMSWLQHDPRKAVAGLNMPVLIVQGTADLQVPVSEAQTLAAAAPRAHLQVIEGMNHLLKMVGTDAELQRKSYGSPAFPVAPQLLESVSSFIKQLAH